MFALLFILAFVTNLAGSMGIIVRSQFGASHAASQFGCAATFAAYFVMGIPGGFVMRRRGYRFTILLALLVGLVGLSVQLLSGVVGSFPVYVAGAFIAGVSVCLLNLAISPLLNTIGGGGRGGNQIVQLGYSLNSLGAMAAPALLGHLIGREVAKARVADAAPALLIAIGVFAAALVVVFFLRFPEPHLASRREGADRGTNGGSFGRDFVSVLRIRHFVFGVVAVLFYQSVTYSIPNMANLYMTAEHTPASVGAVVAGTVVALYWLGMLAGRLVGAALGGRVSSRTMLAFCSAVAIGCLLTIVLMPERIVSPFGTGVPASMCLLPVCGLCTSVMWGTLFNLATEGLGRLVPVGSGIFMTMVVGGLLLPVQGLLADHVGILNSYWLTAGLLAYVLLYALTMSRPRAD